MSVRKIISRNSSLVFIVGGGIATALLWYLVTFGTDNDLNRFEPNGAIEALHGLLKSDRFWISLFETLKRLIIALFAGVIVGVPIGILIGYFGRVRQVTYIPFQILRMISPLSWTPVAIILFGIGAAPVYFLVFIACVWPIIYNTASGVQNSDDIWIMVGRSFGASDLSILRHIVIRACLPSILVGVQLSLGVAWIVIVPAEMLGVASGLGYMILDFRDVSDYSSIAALILVIGVIGLFLDLPLKMLVNSFSW